MSNYFENAKRMIGQGAETAITGIICTAIVLGTRNHRVDEPEVVHPANGFQPPTPLEGAIYFPEGITARTSVKGIMARFEDFTRGTNHDGRARILYDGNPVTLNRPDVPVAIGNGVHAMFTRKNPQEITSDDIAKLNR